MEKCAIFLSGPIGVGKTTLGRALSHRLRAAFIDGDDHSDPGKPWYASVLRTSASIVRTGLAALGDADTLIVAYPLNRTMWFYFQRHFENAGVQSIVVSLRASYAAIVDPRRGRDFDAGERERIRVMIDEGYDRRSFSRLVIDTDRLGFHETVTEIEARLRPLIGTVAAASP